MGEDAITPRNAAATLTTAGTELETERKYEPGPDSADDSFNAVPDLAAVPGIPDGAALRGSGRIALNALYFDTPDLRLSAAGATLRRRTGGDDPGWHLKTPTSDPARRTVRIEPLTTRVLDIPQPLLDEVAQLLGPDAPQALVPVVRMRTARSPRRLTAADGRVLAEIDRDRVTTHPTETSPSGLVPAAWTEIEVELGEAGDTKLLDAIDDAFVAAGLRRSAAPSKLRRALGTSAPSVPAQRAYGAVAAPSEAVKAKQKAAKAAKKADRAARAGKAAAEPSAKPAAKSAKAGRKVRRTTGDIVLGYVGKQVETLHTLEPAVRADSHDAVHRMRVAMRRLRSAFRSHENVLDPEITGPIGDDLRRLATVLGRDRDQEVRAAHLLALVDELDDASVVGPVRATVASWSAEEHAAARKGILKALDGRRWRRVRTALDGLVAEPGAGLRPLAGSAPRPALAAALRADLERFDRRARAARHADVSDPALHAARKAAKRARYCAESAVPVLGREAERAVARLTEVQDVLGAHQDRALTRETLRVLAARAQAEGDSAFTYGVLFERESSASAETASALASVWPKDRLASLLKRLP
ncbi:hypothetical protein BIV57_09175 [Mangrovactinospora gilvigrisea]|uniref:CHAD domain-containing protein n=1 Tax=Mangrovactinospora gilvigrisea TaxID=1428644 RepID=A0A1J7BGD4_9ACTN|nr:CYTH and CHAD domain-containing protein [Mangrovactinospora gilvigrisea]OIV37739.1 hypothetical protein BIV57_09175 [Mangrovactinospora gilvigrisea]